MKSLIVYLLILATVHAAAQRSPSPARIDAEAKLVMHKTGSKGLALAIIEGGKVRYVLASSGHIAGIINPPGGKGTYWVNEDAAPADSPEQWRESAARHDGSWWTDWVQWLVAHSGAKVAPPALGSAAHPALDVEIRAVGLHHSRHAGQARESDRRGAVGVRP